MFFIYFYVKIIIGDDLMKEIKVYETKLPLIVGIIDIITFTIALFFTFHNNSILEIMLCFTIFGLLDFLGLFLILSYYNRKLIIYSDYISYTTSFHHTYIFHISDIKLIESKQRGSFYIISKQNKKLASFESNMINAKDAISYFHKKDIEFHEKEKNNKDIELENQFIKSKWNQNQIKKEKKIVKIINYIFTTIVIVSLFLPSKIEITIMIMTLLFNWIIYLYLYPKMTLEDFNKKKVNRYHIPFPMIPTCISFLRLLMISRIINSDIQDFLSFIFIYAFILSIPYFLILIIRKRKERILKVVLVIGGILLIAFASTNPLNHLLTFTPNKHVLVKVLDKEKHHSRRINSYHLKVNWNGEMKDIEISSQLYKTININDNVKICMRESLFHYQYYVVHK